MWASSTDDSRGTAAASLSGLTGQKLLSQRSLIKDPEPISQCVWGDCDKACPSNTRPAQRSDGKNKGNAGIYNACSKGTRNFCW